MSNIILNILTLGLKPLYSKNVEYYNIIKDFRNKLPREQNEAKSLKNDEIAKNALLREIGQIHAIIDLSTHKISLSESDIDLFYNKIDNFNYQFVFFKNYYKEYTKNLKRFKPKAEPGNFDLVCIQRILKSDSKAHPLKPFDVLIYHLKWKIKITAFVYQFYLKKL